MFRLGDSSDPLVGTDITLLCHNSKKTSPPKWSYFDQNTQQQKVIEEDQPPEGTNQTLRHINVGDYLIERLSV